MAVNQLQRRLTTILAADVAGYSRLTGADEEGTLARIRALRSELIDPAISANRGRVVNTAGDSILIEFSSAVDAVRCAIEVQHGMMVRNADFVSEKQIQFRFGIHLGDVMVESDGDLRGDAVNIAARLEGICEPGGVCLSRAAYEQVKGKVDLAVRDLGEQSLKNIAEPVRVYSFDVGKPASVRPAAPKKRLLLVPLVAGIAVLLVVIAGGAWHFLGGQKTVHVQTSAAAFEPAKPTVPEAAHLSIVVLPFANLSGDPTQDYFVDGITDNLITDLARIKGSFVIARNTAFTYRGKNIDAKEIGKELGVRYVLEGSVQRDQNRGRVNAQLIDAESGAHLWAERFEEDLADLYKLQDQVVARLANTLGFELVKAEAEKSAHSQNPDVIDLDMRGWVMVQQWMRSTKDYNNAARAWFDQALKIDPNDPDALVGDAYTYFIEYALGWTNPEIDYEAKILGQTDRAMAFARDNLWAYYVKCIYLNLSQRAKDALGVADAGLAINPNFARLYVARASVENSLGRFEQAKSDVQQAMRLSPRDPEIGWWHANFGIAELGLHHYQAAIDEEHRAIDAGFRTYTPYSILAAAYTLEDRIDEARSAMAEARRLNPKLSVKWMIARGINDPIRLEANRKAGLPEE